MVKLKKYGLRQMDWADIIVYFLELESKEDFAAKDLVDYFHFCYLNSTGLGYWVQPNYLKETASAKKALEIYGRDKSIELIKVLFEKHEEIFRRSFSEIGWSVGILSSDKTGWIIERALIQLKKDKSMDRNDILKKLLDKPRSEWVFEETKLYNQLMKQGVK